jgi:hypothetical protein
MLAQAMVRLSHHVREAMTTELSLGERAALGAWLLFMAYAEGYRGFQRSFSPRVVTRGLHLARAPRPLDVALAPLFCMGLYRASPRLLGRSWALVGCLVVVIAALHFAPQPWRGLIDAGVVVGLGWGLFALLGAATRALVGRPPTVDPEVR